MKWPTMRPESLFGDRIVAVALAGIVEAAALAGPAGDVEVSESCDGYGTRGSVHMGERAVGRQVRVQDSAIPYGKPVGPVVIGVGWVEQRPVVVAVLTQCRASLGLVVEQDS